MWAVVVAIAVVMSACSSPERDNGWESPGPLPTVDADLGDAARTVAIEAETVYDPCGRFLTMHEALLNGDSLAEVVDLALAWHRDAEALGAGGDLTDAAGDLAVLVDETGGELVDASMVRLALRVFDGWQDSPMVDDPGHRVADCLTFSLSYEAVLSAYGRCVEGLAEFADGPLTSPDLNADNFEQLVELQELQRFEELRVRDLWRDCATRGIASRRVGEAARELLEGRGEALLSLAGRQGFLTVSQFIDPSTDPIRVARRVIDIDAPIAIPESAAATYREDVAPACTAYTALVQSELDEMPIDDQLGLVDNWLAAFDGTFVDTTADRALLDGIRSELKEVGGDLGEVSLGAHRNLISVLGASIVADVDASRLGAQAHSMPCEPLLVTSEVAALAFERCLVLLDAGLVALSTVSEGDPAQFDVAVDPVVHTSTSRPICGLVLETLGAQVSAADVQRILRLLSPEAQTVFGG